MAKKKKSKGVSIGQKEIMTSSPTPTSPTSPASLGSKKPKVPATASTSAASSLVICRNKHWRFISAFHGPWLQMPIEILETIANINYNTPRPRPLDPAVFFDIVKVRRLVDEATNLAVRAASDIASPTLTNVNGGIPDVSTLHSLGIGGVPGHGAKLSRERKFRMREQASQKLARAYRLDEIASSVATMQGSSPLEEVGSSVLQRNPKDPDARYVHFFHEKIPSRQMAESTSLEPLTEIIGDRPGEPEALRTRATVKIFKDDLEGAAQDLTHALQMCRFRRPSHTPTPEELQLQAPNRTRRRQQDIILAEKDQPSGLEGQLLFLRASVYLALSCNYVRVSLPAENTPRSPDASSNGQADGKSQDQEPDKKTVEARKAVKLLAKRALRDYMAFLSQFEYSPNLPIRTVRDFNERVNAAAHGVRNPRASDNGTLGEPPTVYALSDLFAAVPPTGLPPYPSQEIAKSTSSSPQSTTCEWATYHPLLADSLHALLLCHCLAQTSTKELQRHAYMVSRIVRLLDGYPVFQASRSPARADWTELLRRSNNWLELSTAWENLCAPAPLPLHDSPMMPKPAHSPELAASAAAALVNGDSAQSVAEEVRKERLREKAILDALDDERVVDETTFRAAVKAREKRAEEEHKHLSAGGSSNGEGGKGNGARPHSSHVAHQHYSHCECPHHHQSPSDTMHRWANEDGGKEYPLLSERASAISYWVRAAPVVTGTAKRKKRPKRAPADGNEIPDTMVDEMQKLEVDA